MINHKDLNNRYIDVIAATTSAATSNAYELMGNEEYTISCSTLAVNEEVLLEIYDKSKEQWQPYMLSGVRLKMVKDYEQITIPNVACIVRFVKTVTAQSVGVTLSYKGVRYVNTKALEEL